MGEGEKVKLVSYQIIEDSSKILWSSCNIDHLAMRDRLMQPKLRSHVKHTLIGMIKAHV